MQSVAHLVVTDNFAGTERYVCQLANASAARGWKVSVIGGESLRGRGDLLDGVTWYPGATLTQAARSLYLLGKQDVCHAHLTLAELVASALRWRHQARVISTRHIAARRGSTGFGRLLAPWIAWNVDQEISISHFVSDQIESSRSVTIHNGVHHSELQWDPESRVVLVVQRLEPEKDTGLALKAWQLSRLATMGWHLRIVGDGSERASLEAFVMHEGIPGVDFLGARSDIPSQLAGAGIFLATAPREPLGLSVLEAMAAGVPVIAACSGGHLETLSPQMGMNGFPPGDEKAAASCLARLARDVVLRRELSLRERERQSEHFTLDGMADRIHLQYDGRSTATEAAPKGLT